MNNALRAALLATYALAAVSLFGLLPGDLAQLLQRIVLVVLVIHVVELLLVFKHVRTYQGSLAASVLLTLLFGLLHWKPLADARRGQGRP